MNDELLEYTFDEIEVGLKKEFQIKITESLVNDFAKISGDFSPIHINEEYAKGTIFKKEIIDSLDDQIKFAEISRTLLKALQIEEKEQMQE